MLVQSVSINFTYSSPGLLVGGRVRSILALDESERLKRKEKRSFTLKIIIEMIELRVSFIILTENVSVR